VLRFYKNRPIIGVVLFCVAITFFSFIPQAFAAFPERSINWILTSAPGGGTDSWGRTLASIMEKSLGQKIVLNNMVGAGGATGTAYVWQAKHDGYTLCSANDSTPSLAVMTGMQQTTASNWEFFIAGGSPGVLCANAESGFGDFESLLKEARQQPGKFKVASCAGSVWFIQAAVFSKYCDLPLGNVPIPGTQPAILACVAGETPTVVASIGEVADFVKAGKLIPLVTMQDKDYEMQGYGTIPSILKLLPAYKDYLTLRQWQGFMVPDDTPSEIKSVLSNAFETAMRSPQMEEFRASQYAVFYALSGPEALNFARNAESLSSWILHDMNLAQHNPEGFGIKRP
jgi:tripartite-type tricarboxylate transporter receptor subunit TctC